MHDIQRLSNRAVEDVGINHGKSRGDASNTATAIAKCKQQLRDQNEKIAKEQEMEMVSKWSILFQNYYYYK